MLLSEGDQRSSVVDIRLAAFFSGTAGAVNAAGFQATGLFSANQTGNASAMSDHFGLGDVAAAALFGAVVVVFIAGAFSSGLLIELGQKRGVRAIYGYSIVLESILLLLVGCLDGMAFSVVTPSGIILALSFVMGLQNAATTRISNARVRTTHVSGMATDVGLGLSALVTCAPDRDSALSRLKLYAVTITAFVSGGVLGVISYLAVGGWVFALAGGLLLAVALPEVRRARRR